MILKLNYMDTTSNTTKQYLRTDLPPLQVGDKVEITTKNFNPNEKNEDDGKQKHRLTRFKGTVIAQKNPHQISYTFSVLRDSKGVDKVAIKGVFSYHSPLIVSIKKVPRSVYYKRPRRAKLNYLERELARMKG